MSKDLKGRAKSSLPPGANWLALKSTLDASPAKKKRRISSINSLVATSFSTLAETPSTVRNAPSTMARAGKGADNDIPYLRSMILGRTTITPSSSGTNGLTDPKIGKYIALDCEMVGVGPPTVDERTGKIITESSLARVSLVNYHGEVLFDTFVKQKERVTDYRTHVSGVRPKDLVGPKALSLEEAQRRVADTLKGRILVGHAVFNDLKALLLKHSSADIRDTQKNTAIRTAYKTSRPALRAIIQKEFNLDIQGGEHSSVIDARATMALYRLYKNRPAGRPQKGLTDKMTGETGDEASLAQPRSRPLEGIDSMPFTESKTAVHSDFETGTEADSDVDVDVDVDVGSLPLHERHPPPSPEYQKTSSSSSKKRKYTSDAAADPPLVLHVASDSTPERRDFSLQSLPSHVNPPSGTKYFTGATKKMSKRTTGEKSSRNSGIEYPGGGKKGISSGLSTVVRVGGTKTIKGRMPRHGKAGVANSSGKDDWWSKL